MASKTYQLVVLNDFTNVQNVTQMALKWLFFRKPTKITAQLGLKAFQTPIAFGGQGAELRSTSAKCRQTNFRFEFNSNPQPCPKKYLLRACIYTYQKTTSFKFNC